MGRRELTAWLKPWVVLTLVGACSSAPAPSVCDASTNARCGAGQIGWDAAGLRVALSSNAKSVCVLDQGCAEGPKGAIRIQPLQPKFREAVSQALQALGFQLVDLESERDMVADVEWRGTDTIALRLQDAHGRFIDQASFSRSLERCRELPDLNWETCWAANFERMKQELTRPLENSVALLAFARKTKSSALGGDRTTPGGSSDVAFAGNLSLSAGTAAPRERLDSSQLQQTVARYAKEMEKNCWLPAIEARQPTASTSARISTFVSINPSGGVDSVTTAGDPPGYLHLASCVATELRRWRFPQALQATTASIPFVFAGN